MIVVDASAAAAALFHDGPARARLGSEVVHVPGLIDTELLGIMRRHVRAGHMSAVAATRALDVWRQLGLSRHDTTHLIERIWTLRDHLGVPDATYVALAEHLQATLVTADARLASAPATRCPIEVLAR